MNASENSDLEVRLIGRFSHNGLPHGWPPVTLKCSGAHFEVHQWRIGHVNAPAIPDTQPAHPLAFTVA